MKRLDELLLDPGFLVIYTDVQFSVDEFNESQISSKLHCRLFVYKQPGTERL